MQKVGLQGSAWTLAAGHHHRKYTNRRYNAVRCSIGHSGSRNGSSSHVSGPAQSSQTRREVRVSGVAAQNPLKETAKPLIGDLEEQRKWLNATFSTQNQISVSDLPQRAEEPGTSAALPESLDKLRSKKKSKSRFPASTTSSVASTNGAEPVLVPSTRLPRSQRIKNVKHTNLSKVPDISRKFSLIKSVEPEDDDLAEDADFLGKLRSWLRENRSTKGRRNMKERPDGISDASKKPGSAFSSLLSSLGNTPLLNAKQEQRLARIIGRGKTVRQAAIDLASSTGKRPSLEAVAEKAGLPSATATARAVLMAEDARDLMVAFNIRMVVSIAKKYLNKGLETSDLVPEGISGLRKAVDRYDPDKGFRFSTYAHWWVRQAVTRAISDQGRDVRLPVHVVESIMKMRKIRTELHSQPGREGVIPTHKEVAAAMGLPVNRFVSFLRSVRNPKSVDEIASLFTEGSSQAGVKDLGKDGPLMDELLLPDDVDDYNGEAAEERLEHIREIMTFLLSTLDTRERNILRLRYGLHYTIKPDEMRRAICAVQEDLATGGPSGSDNYKINDINNLFNISGSASGVTASTDFLDVLMEDVAVDFETGEIGLGLKATGALYDLSRERIRQVESRALKKLRSSWRLKLLEKMREGKPLKNRDFERMSQAMLHDTTMAGFPSTSTPATSGQYTEANNSSTS